MDEDDESEGTSGSPGVAKLAPDNDSPAMESPPSLAATADPYEVDVTLPGCDSSDPSVHRIRRDADWDSINDPGLRVFCVQPGDYRSVGRIELKTSGTPSRPRVIRYYDPLAPERTLHPVRMMDSKQARVLKLWFLAQAHWIVDGIALLNSDPDTSLLNTTINLRPGSSNIILQGLLVEGGRTGLLIERSSHNVLQRSVVRNTVIIKADANCIDIRAGTGSSQLTGNRIVSNEAYDCTDSLQIMVREPGVGTTFPGTIVANNDFYLTPARYTDCEGRFDPDGACAAAEGRFDIKGGGTSSDPSGRVHVTRNRIWGSRKTDSKIGGGGSWGTGLESCCYPSRYLLIEKNIITDVSRGIGSSHTSRSTIRDNVIYNVFSPYDGQGTAFYGAGDAVEFYRNTVISAVRSATIVGRDNDIRCNTFIDIRDPSHLDVSATGLEMDYNAYYATPIPTRSGPHDIVRSTTNAARHEELCFERRIITGPEIFCIPNGRATAESPHADLCDSSLGTRFGVGIDDLIPERAE